MNDRPTPRTEAMIAAHSEEDDCCGAIILCRALEREVDELREALEQAISWLEDCNEFDGDLLYLSTTLKNTEPKP